MSLLTRASRLFALVSAAVCLVAITPGQQQRIQPAGSGATTLGAPGTQQVCFTDSVPLQTSTWADSVTIPLFDPCTYPGVLVGVSVTLDAHIEGSVGVESLDMAPSTVTLTWSGTLEVKRPNNSTLVIANPSRTFVENLSAFDGVVDLRGTSGRFFPGLVQDEQVVYTAPPPASDLALFTGAGNIVLPVTAEGTAQGMGPANAIIQFSQSASAMVTVCYDYLPDCDCDGISDADEIAQGAPDCNMNGVPDDCEPDCDGDGVPDDCEEDCNQNGTPDDCEDFQDCNGNGIPDECDLRNNDCNSNGIPDECDEDCNDNGTPDDCEQFPDCNGNGIPDECELVGNDCNSNGIPDECDEDCNGNGTPDDCEQFTDCNDNDIPDECELVGNDCNSNGIPDECDEDCNDNGTPDDCEQLPDCNMNGVPDECEVFEDCNSNDIPDECELVGNDCDGNGVPDECQPDCDGDGLPDVCEIDCNNNGTPDDCEQFTDCNMNGVPDECELGEDCNGNGIPDECDPDCDGDGTPDDCEPGADDCNGNGVPDDCDVDTGSDDCNGNGIPDECEPDCNGNGIADECDITGGTSMDSDGNGVPDECECETPNRRMAGSLLLYPEYDNREGANTILSVTNQSRTQSVWVEFIFIDSETCLEFNRSVHLTPNDTFTAYSNTLNPGSERGFLYVFAKQAIGPAPPIVFNHLIGQLIALDGLESEGYAVNAVSFKGVGEKGTLTDVDLDGHRDLNGIEYEQAPDELLVPRFLGQNDVIASELVLVALSGGMQFTTQVNFLIYNDNEQQFSAQHTFHCWDKRPLVELSAAFGNDFLMDNTDDDPFEIGGWPGQESGWFRVDGNVAQSFAKSIPDPAIYVFLIERKADAPSAAADLPWELCTQDNGSLLPLSLHGDNED